MTTTQMQEFARMGAEARLRAIGDERHAILQAFPDLGDGSAPVGRASSPPGRKRRRMSAAEREAVGRRMRAYWAKRRAEKAAGAKKAAPKAKRKGGMSAEARRRQGERMKAYWAKRWEEKAGGAEGGQAEAANGSGKASRKGRTK